ncbi:hypothetical protein DLM77_06935 [Leptospira yasudae]|uniref:Uncharacterized protein n=1 Tax=Leptospira yasudae TaxID=2202201 RepID=A0ABX9M4H9_9LEPT|nr:hypothetical protein DLM77_06935 [Leptospira yasudae]
MPIWRQNTLIFRSVRKFLSFLSLPGRFPKDPQGKIRHLLSDRNGLDLKIRTFQRRFRRSPSRQILCVGRIRADHPPHSPESSEKIRNASPNED